MAGVKRFSVQWTETARRDLESIVDHVAEESVDRAEDILGRLQRTASRLSSLPERGRVVPELKEQGILVYRELQSPPWRLIYRLDGRSAIILAVIDGRRNLEDLLLDRFLR